MLLAGNTARGDLVRDSAATTGRTFIDRDGRLRLLGQVISVAGVNRYWGREIPDIEHGLPPLDPKRVFRLLRGPDALAEAADSFRGVQLLDRHAGVSVTNHPAELVIGCVGSDVTFDGMYLRASITVWGADAIRDIETRARRSWSIGYRYRPDMTPGEYEGTPYDGRMTEMVGNHLALVESGRAGPDVDVVIAGDGAIRSRRYPTVASAAFEHRFSQAQRIGHV